MRADFYGRCASHDRLARLVGANQVLVGPMRATSCAGRSSSRRAGWGFVWSRRSPTP